MIKQTVRFFLTVSIPLGFIVYWHIFNQTLPRNDEAYYLLAAQESYFAFQWNGFWKGLAYSYLFHGWKPVLHIYFAVPFFFITGGEILATKALCCSFLFLAFITTVYWYFSKHFRGVRLFLALTFIGTLPFILYSGHSLYPEVSFLICVLPILSYTENFLSSQQNTSTCVKFSLWLALSFCIRPVESLLAYTPVLFLLIWKHFKQKRISLGELLAMASIVFITCAVLAKQAYRYESNALKNCIYLLLLVLPLGFLFSLKKLKKISELSVVFSVFFALTVFWYAPNVYTLWSWVWECTFGTLAVQTGGDHHGVVSSLTTTLYILGYLAAAILALAALLRAPRLSEIRKNITRYLPALFLITIPVILGTITHNTTARYYFSSALVFFVISTLLVLSPQGKFPRLRIAVFSFFILISIWQVFHFVIPNGKARWPRIIYPLYSEMLPEKEKDLALRIYQSVSSHLQKVKPGKTCIAPLPHNGKIEWASDPWLLTLLSRKDELKQTFVRLNGTEAPTLDERFKQLQAGCRYVLVMPVEHFGTPSVFFDSSLALKILEMNDFKKLAHEKYAEFEGKDVHYLLLENQNKP